MAMRKPGPEHIAFRNDLIALLTKHGSTLQAEEILALVAHMLGQVIALQDQRVMSKEAAMEIVVRNIEAGNMDAIKGLFNQGGKG